MSAIYSIVDLIILATGIIVIIYSAVLVSKCWNKWFLFLPIILWAGHLSIFYSLVVYADITGTTLDAMFGFPGLMYMWSTLQRFHGVITMLFVVILLATEIQYDYFRKGCNDK